MVDGEEFKERVREATDIVAIIGQYVTLKKRGKNILGLCPFHTEKTPSFTVHPDRQFYHCFGCGKGGDVFTFLMEHEGWSFPEALKYLAEKAGIPLPKRRKPEDADRYTRLYTATAAAAELFSRMIRRPEGKHALEYIMGRGVQSGRLAEFGIGYAPNEWDGLLKFCERRNISKQTLIDAGLVVVKEETKSVYDRFRNRLTFTIRNLSGRVVGFGARALEQTERAKYINSPETPIYQKSRILYGLDMARDSIRRDDYVVVVEGYTDWISLYQAGITNLVASSGTAFSPEQARLLLRFSPNVVLLFDADFAGQQAALRGVEILFREGLEVKIAALPSGSDPDTAIREHGADYLRELLSSAQGYVQFRVSRSREALTTGGLVQRETVIKELLSTASVIEDRVRRALIVRQISDATGLSEADLLAQLPRGAKPSNAPAAARPTHIRLRGRPEEEFLKLLLDKPEYIATVRAEVRVEDFQEAELGRMYQSLLKLKPANKTIKLADLGQSAEDYSRWAEIEAFDLGPDVNLEMLAEYVKIITAGRHREILRELKRKIREADNRGDLKEYERLARELAEYRDRLREKT